MNEIETQPARQTFPLVGIFFVMVVIAAALFFFSAAYLDWREYGDSGDWLETTGTVTEIGTKEIKDDDEILFAPRIAYTYTVNGKAYEGDRISFDSRPYVEEENAAEDANEYTIGQEVTVLYNPDDPQQSVLERTTNWSGVIGFSVIGVIFLIFGAVLASGMLKRTRSKKVVS